MSADASLWVLIAQALAIPLSSLAIGLSGTADSGRVLARAFLGGLLVVSAELHLAVDTLALQLLFQSAERLVDVVVTNDDLHIASVSDHVGAGIRLAF